MDVVEKVLLVLLCFIFPPIAVLVKGGLSVHLLLSLVLTFFMYVPGLIHAIWYTLARETPNA